MSLRLATSLSLCASRFDVATDACHLVRWICQQIGEFKQTYTWDENALGFVYAKKREDVPQRLLDAML